MAEKYTSSMYGVPVEWETEGRVCRASARRRKERWYQETALQPVDEGLPPATAGAVWPLTGRPRGRGGAQT